MGRTEGQVSKTTMDSLDFGDELTFGEIIDQLNGKRQSDKGDSMPAETAVYSY